MSFAISVFVGRKFGTWAKGLDRYRTADLAKEAMRAIRSGEHKAGATMMDRRVTEA